MRFPKSYILSVLAFLCLVVGISAEAAAQRFLIANRQDKGTSAEDGDQNLEVPEVDPNLQERLKSPQATMRSFLDSVNNDRLEEAAACLDFSRMNATVEARRAKEKELAFKLKAVLDKIVRIEVPNFTNDGTGEQPFSLNQAHDVDVEDQTIAAQIVLAKSGDGLWRFSPDTVAAIEEFYEFYLERDPIRELTAENRAKLPPKVWLAQQFPVEMQKTRFLIPDYQWVALVIVGLLGFIADRLTRLVLAALTSTWFRLRDGTRAPVVRDMWRPVGLFMQGATWYYATYHYIGLPDTALSVLLAGVKFFAVVAAVWTAFHLIDLLSRVALRQTAKTDTRFDDLLVPLVSKSLKVVAVCTGVLLFAGTFVDWKVAGVLGGVVGLGGMAVAFAAQDAISNIFGSVTVLLDRPFEVGDWVVTDGIEGAVETVGFRSTRIRTFYNSLITLPNSKLTTAAVDNMGRRKYRRFKTTLGVQYDTTPDQIEAFCEGVRELLRRHPYTRKDYFHVYFNDLSDSSLDILLYCFFECPDWSIELRERHRLLVDIMKLAERLGVQFAFPTRTLHMLQGDASASEPPMDCSDPMRVGQVEAARIAGSFATAADS